RAVFHDLALREPDERARRKRAFVGDQLALEDVHAVAARVGVPRVDDAGGVADEAHFGAGRGGGVEGLAEERFGDVVVEPLLPWLARRVDREEFVVWHGDSKCYRGDFGPDAVGSSVNAISPVRQLKPLADGRCTFTGTERTPTA